MTYSKRNHLQKIVEVQNITLEHTKKGVSQEWIFMNLIYPQFYISRATYYRYLSTPAKAELKRLFGGEIS